VINLECYKKEHCRLCDSTHLQNVLKLTPTPPGNHFVKKEQLGITQACYPLELDFCEQCKHVQLGHVVDPKILYQKNYSYVSGTSPVFVKHLREYCEYITQRYALSQDGLVLDIGSNDGTALRFFKDAGYRVLGIDPATEIVHKANKNGIETLCDFFNLDIAKKYKPRYGKAKLINSHNACAHIDDLSGVIEGVKYWLADDGLFVMEVGYLLDIYENTWFDTIYHEHVDYHTVAPLVPFFKRFNMEVIHAKRISPQGGSVRVIVQHKNGPFSVDDSVGELVSLEQNKGLDQTETFKNFGTHINQIKKRLSEIIVTLKAKGKSIASFGAPTKATTLLSHFELADHLDFLVDDNPLKQGLHTPGSHIPVCSADALYEQKPDYLLILAWNFAQNIMEKHQAYLKQGGQFILPMPEPKIVAKDRP